jgi:hypothetical protein
VQAFQLFLWGGQGCGTSSTMPGTQPIWQPLCRTVIMKDSPLGQPQLCPHAPVPSLLWMSWWWSAAAVAAFLCQVSAFACG